MAVPKTEPIAGLTAERWAEIQSIFHAALEHGAEHRTAFLDRACVANPDVRAEVESLLAAEPAARGFLEAVTSGILETLDVTGPAASSQRVEFPGNDRFLLRRKLGSGGFGTVFEAFDREQNAVVALKNLHRVGPSELYRFKREFRSLAGIAHSNLVSLYELLSDGEHWFFTMEMVDGSHFVDFIRESGSTRDWAKLRAALAQLAEGVCALHESGRLHRDLKPSNVLVATNGRVVIVDFGLIADVNLEEFRTTRAGTPAYMAPEHLETGRASTSTDWYAVGVILFEALTGRLPFDGDFAQIRAAKTVSPAPRASQWEPSVPQDLDDLCAALLSRRSWERPTGQEVLRSLGVEDSGDSSLLQEGALIGREQELAKLQDALRSVAAGGTIAVCVTGGSGVGKSALISQFLNRVRGDDSFVTLAGRCYDQESVPYKGLDEVVDALAAHLGSLPDSDARAMMQGSAALAARLFPILETFTATRRLAKIDSQELQQAAFAGFRRLLQRVSERKPLIVCIDDLQWANADSLQLLTELLRPPQPVMLLIVCYRIDDDPITHSPLAAWQSNIAALAKTAQIALTQLTSPDAQTLASLLVREVPDRAEWIDRIARESAGNPFLLSELAHYARSDTARRPGAGPASMEEMLHSRVASLPEAARRLIEIVTIAGQPLESQIAWKAAQYEGAQQSALGVLRAQRLIRIRRVRDRQEIEIYHDRIRQSIARRLPPESKTQRHLCLAVELESSSQAAPESLAAHFREGRESQKAFHYAILAAEAASSALAFERAVYWYEFALAEKQDREVRVRLADALGSSGRGKEAADIYLESLDAAAPADRIELRRKAANELLISGHTHEGLEVLKDVLRAIGMRLPTTALGAIPSLLWNRARIRIRGLGVGRRPPGKIAAQEVQRVDVCWSVTRGLGMVDTIRSAEFHSRSLLAALSLGDSYRASRALSVEAAYSALSGEKGHTRTQHLLRVTKELAEACDNPHALGLAKLITGMSAFLEGRWAIARDALLDAELFLRERCAGVAWELATARFMHTTALYFLGEIKDLCARLPVLLENAKARGDLYESTHLQIRVAHVQHLAFDRPDIADVELREAIARRPEMDFYLQHWWAMIAGIEIAMYRGDAAGAWRLVSSRWPALRRSLLMGLQYIRIESFLNRALAAIAYSATEPQQVRRLLRIARSDATRIEREKAVWSSPFASLIRGAAAAIERRPEIALEHWTAAETAFGQAGMKLLAAATQRRRGQLIGGDDGLRLIAAADAAMEAEGIRNPRRMTEMLIPGGSSVP